jgi:hypothetical protein
VTDEVGFLFREVDDEDLIERIEDDEDGDEAEDDGKVGRNDVESEGMEEDRGSETG